MPHDELPFTSATDALAAFRSGELSPVELLDAVLARAAVVEPHVNALVTVRREAAYAAAREAEARYRGAATATRDRSRASRSRSRRSSRSRASRWSWARA